MPDGHTLTLSEHDMTADGTSTWRDPRNETDRVNGAPARLVVLQAASGKAVSHLSWTEGRRGDELWIDANVAHQPLRAQLFSLAASLPPSVPACPHETPPLQIRLGADGKPDYGMPPAALTLEVAANQSDGQRACK